MDTPKSIERVIDALSVLPSIGRRGAERIAYSLLDLDEEKFHEIVDSIVSMKENLHECPVCGAIIDGDTCPICSDSKRDKHTLMVVSYSRDIITLEKNKEYNGVYHVLGGVISPSKGIGPDDLNISTLVERVKNEGISEVIMATNPTSDGELTARYISENVLKPLHVNVTRLGYGLQSGGSIEYLDAMTFGRALSGRTKL